MRRKTRSESLADLQRATFGYFIHETNPENGLVPDNTREDSHCSITAVGLALASYPVGVARGYIDRDDAVARIVTALRFFRDAPHSDDPDATGHRGFYYHFLDMERGRRAWKSELSTIDSTFLIAGGLMAAAYFDRDTEGEREIRDLADELYRRVDWEWALNGGSTVSLGWKPESGFIKYRWQGYNEALLLYVLGLASPTHPLPEESYAAWCETYKWKKLYGIEFLYSGPLFIHQLSHVWIDFRGVQDAYMRRMAIDYFENSRRATYVQQRYAIENPRGFVGYGEHAWGVTASDGPGWKTCTIDGVERRFFAYRARGVPFGPDDGTLAPWAAVASLPFAPDIVLSALDHYNEQFPEMTSKYGFKCSLNPTYEDGDSPKGWISQGYYGLDQGPIVLMIENYRTGLPWRLMRGCSYIVDGLRKAGFRNGWLEGRS